MSVVVKYHSMDGAQLEKKRGSILLFASEIYGTAHLEQA
jgi:hypothetical protein